jgi:hypothetical protein
LKRAIVAIWRAHGDGMAELLQQRATADMASDREYLDDGDPNALDDFLF